MEYQTTHTSSTMSWIALIIAAIALWFSWIAFNRTGSDLEQIIRDQVNAATADIERNYSEMEATIRANTVETLQEASQDVATDTAPGVVGE